MTLYVHIYHAIGDCSSFELGYRLCSPLLTSSGSGFCLMTDHAQGLVITYYTQSMANTKFSNFDTL